MSAIEWTDTTWNPVRGCSRVSEGCRNCYAERMAGRFSDPGELEDPGVWLHEPGPFYRFAEMTKAGPRWTGRVELIPEKLDEPLRWRKPRRVFVNSMSDLFHEALPDDAIGRVFEVMGTAERHTFQVLTKRPGRMLEFMRTYSAPGGPLAVTLQNVWLGVSCEDQRTADERIPLLLQTPAAVRFVSLEPLLGPITFLPSWVAGYDYRGGLKHTVPRLDWVIVGGESGPGARPCDVAWVRSIVHQCREAGVACFVKQLGRLAHDGHLKLDGPPVIQPLNLKHPKGGEPAEWPEDLRVREFPQ